MKIMKKEKVLEGEVMSEEELKKSRSERAALDFFLSPAGMDFFGNALLFFFNNQRCGK